MEIVGFEWKVVPGEIPSFVRRVKAPHEGQYHKTALPLLSLNDTISKSALCYISPGKVWACGDFYEVTRMREGVLNGVPAPSTASGKEKEDKDSVQARSAARARRKVRRLVNTNRLTDMVTLTLAPDVNVLDSRNKEKWVQISIEEQKDRQRVIELWDRFRRKMRGGFSGVFPYVAVIEKHTGKRAQDDTVKKGTYHIHYCTKLSSWQLAHPYQYQGMLQRVWGHGLCNVTPWNVGRRSRDLGPIDLPPVSNAGAYMSKYFGHKDDASTGRDEGQRRYWTSKGLKKPVCMEVEEIDAVELELVFEAEQVIEGRRVLVSQTYRRIN